MKKVKFSKLIGGKSGGFSLVGVMIAAAMLGGLSLAVMKLTSQQAKMQKSAETNFEVRSLSSEISQLLLSAKSCKNTFDDLGSIQNTTNVPAVKNRNDDDKISVGDTFNNNIEIVNMELRDQTWGPPSPPSNNRFGEGKLYVTFEKISDMAQGGKIVRESFPLKFDVDSSYNVLRCYGATENAVDTSKKESCELIGGTYNSNTDTCELFPYEDSSPDRETAVSTKYLDDYMGGTLDDRYVNLSGDTMTGALNVEADISTLAGGNISSEGNITATSGSGIIEGNQLKVGSGEEICIGPNCRTTFQEQNCNVGEVISQINPDGTVQCANVTCPSDTEFYVGIDNSGNVKCKPFPTETCPTDHYVTKVYDDGSVDCKEVPETEKISGQNCSGGQVVTGIDNNGNLKCDSLPDRHVYSESCSSGEYVKGFDSSGNPICSNTSWGDIAGKPGAVSCPLGSYQVYKVNFSDGSIKCVDQDVYVQVCMRCQYKGGQWERTWCEDHRTGRPSKSRFDDPDWGAWAAEVNETRHSWRKCKLFVNAWLDEIDYTSH